MTCTDPFVQVCISSIEPFGFDSALQRSVQKVCVAAYDLAQKVVDGCKHEGSHMYITAPVYLDFIKSFCRRLSKDKQDLEQKCQRYSHAVQVYESLQAQAGKTKEVSSTQEELEQVRETCGILQVEADLYQHQVITEC